MSTAKSLICLLAATLALAGSASAGDSGGASTYRAERENPWTALAWHVHTRRESRWHALQVAGSPFLSFLHFPQIISETLQGDRALVNKRGVLGPNEVPSEDTVYSPDE